MCWIFNMFLLLSPDSATRHPMTAGVAIWCAVAVATMPTQKGLWKGVSANTTGAATSPARNVNIRWRDMYVSELFIDIWAADTKHYFHHISISSPTQRTPDSLQTLGNEVSENGTRHCKDSHAAPRPENRMWGHRKDDWYLMSKRDWEY